MTYNYRYWSAFREADLLNAGDHNVSIGDTFVMPGAATVKLAAWDNDGQLSGDNYERATDADQFGWVNDGSGWHQTGDLYVEKTFTLHGSDGKTYVLAEIEGECHDAAGTGDDYFSFVGAVPPAGVTLSVASCTNSHGVNYADLSADAPAHVNSGPVFDNLPTNGVLHINENETAVIDVNASDADGDTLTYKIVGGRDGAFFEIDAQTGELSFKDAPDFENPASGGNSNTYDVTVEVSDGNGGTQTKALWVKVADVDENTGGALECIVIEAEDMDAWGFRTVHGSQASGGDLVKLGYKGTGDLSTTFEGDAGTYDLTLFAQDETDGQSTVMVKVNGVVVQTITLDQDSDGGGSDNSGFSEFTVEGLELESGDTIALWARADNAEYVRIDKIKLQEVEAADTNDASLAGRVFMDNNDNNVDDAGDMGIAGVTVTLSNGQTTVTDANGNYEFTGLAAGDYSVTFPTDVNGKVLVDANAGGDDTIDSDAGANGSTGTITLGVGERSEDNDAGVEDPGTASIGNKVFLDANGNGQQDAGEQGVDGVQVTLFNAAGMAVSTITTTNGGMYLFENLDAGDYSVGFEAPEGFDLTDANVGLDGSDSDADQGTGRTDTISLEIGEDDRSVDAGLVAQNNGPDAGNDDAGETCANEDKTVDVLANDTDADGDALSVTAVNGQAISEGQTINVDGVDVSLVGGSLVFNGEAAYEDLDIGESADVTYTYTVSDGTDTDTADINLSFKGVAEDIQDICDSLPSSINYQIVDEYENGNDGAFTLKIDGSGDARLDGLVIEAGYCVSAFDPALGGSTFVDAPIYSANLYCTDDDAAMADVLAGQMGINGQSAADNMDLVNWILNQEFSENGYTDAEVQGAIWSLTDSIDFVRPEYGDLADVQEIVALAEANGEGFEAGPGGIVGLLVDPNPATDTNSQPFVLAVDFDSLDCLC